MRFISIAKIEKCLEYQVKVSFLLLMFPPVLLWFITLVLLIITYLGIRKYWKYVNRFAFWAVCTYTLLIVCINYYVYPLDQWKNSQMYYSFIFWLLPLPVLWILPKDKNIYSFKKSIELYFWIWLGMVLLDYSEVWAEKYTKNPFLYMTIHCLLWNVVYIAIPLIAILLQRATQQDCALKIKMSTSEKRYLIIAIIGIIALTGYASFDKEFVAYYPFVRTHHTQQQIIYELAYGSSFFGLELFFRGFSAHLSKKVFNEHGILLMMCFYVLLHLGKPMPECISAMFGAILLGTLSVQTQSITFGFIGHLTMAWSMDLWALWQY